MSERAQIRLGVDDYHSLVQSTLNMLRLQMGDRLVAVALFGSVARGEANPHSDLDFFIVHRGDQKQLHRTFVKIALELRERREYRELEKCGILADPYAVMVSIQKLTDTPWILLDIMDHGIILHDPRGILKVKLNSLRIRLEQLGSRKIVLEDGTWYWDLKPDWKPGEVFEL